MIFLFTNRKECSDNELLLKIREAALAGADYIMLREVDLDDEAYYQLALSALQMTTHTRCEIVICHRDHIADKLGLKKHNRFRERHADSFTVATHSKGEYDTLEGLFFYSPVFETDCKPGVEPKGTGLYHPKMIALGGIKKERLSELRGFKHVGIMSEWLRSDQVFHLIKTYKKYGY